MTLINDKTEMTRQEAVDLYPEHYIYFVFTEIVDYNQNDRGYVVAISDDMHGFNIDKSVHVSPINHYGTLQGLGADKNTYVGDLEYA